MRFLMLFKLLSVVLIINFFLFIYYHPKMFKFHGIGIGTTQMTAAKRTKIVLEKQMNVKKFEGPTEPSSITQRMNFTIRFTNVNRNYSMEKPHPGICNGINLLVLVMSRRESAIGRHGIRQSWAKDAPKDVLIRFVVGGPMASEKDRRNVNTKLMKEQSQFGDLILYDIEDGYGNLHFKMSAAFQWQQTFCNQTEFVMKTDDDTIVDLPRWKFCTEKKFRKDLEANKAAFFGYLLTNKKPIRDPTDKWYVPKKSFLGKVYPDYLQGATYFGTNKAIAAVMAHTKEVFGFNMDDILFTGILAKKANAILFNYAIEHFRGWPKIFPIELCQHGVPMVFSYLLPSSPIKTVEQYKNAYLKLHKLKCF